MNTSMQICGIIVLCVLLVLFSMKRNKLFLNTEKTFLVTAIVTLFANTMDIVCQFILDDPSSSSLVMEIGNKIYQMSLVLIMCCAMLYVSRDIFVESDVFMRKSWYFLAIFCVSAVLIAVLPEKISTVPGRLYATGPSVIVTYAFCIYYMIAIIIRVNVMRNRMNRDRRNAINLWMVLWVVAALSEFVFPHLLIVSFAASVGVMILYIKLENPGMNMDRQSGMYNQNAFIEYLQQMYGAKAPFAMMIMVPLSYGDSLYDHSVDMKRLARIFEADKAAMFRKSEDEIALVFEDVEDAKAWAVEYSERTWHSTDPDVAALRKGLWVYIKDSGMFNDSDELLYFIKYVIANKSDKIDAVDRNYIYVNEVMVEDMRVEKHAEKILDEALSENRIEVFYQPIYSIEKKKFVSAEALVRIRDEEGNVIKPEVFVPVAEKNGKIIEVGNEVFRQVCKMLQENDVTKYGVEYIEVNLSVAQCADNGLADSYISTMNEFDINPKLINLEITESASMKSKEVLLGNMKRLIEYGINFSLDDFGTGQSNLNYIVDMPVEIVKFDRDMTTAYFDNKKAKYVMDAAMHMIHGMGLKIVSEGIETIEQYNRMKDLGISYIQGFYFSKPLDKDSFIRYIKENNKGAKNV